MRTFSITTIQRDMRELILCTPAVSNLSTGWICKSQRHGAPPRPTLPSPAQHRDSCDIKRSRGGQDIHQPASNHEHLSSERQQINYNLATLHHPGRHSG